jgi:hypothetical protein
LKKIVLIVALTFGALVTSCNKKVEKTTEEEMTSEQITPEVVDGMKTDTVAPMVEAKDSISPKK